jgi:ferredoxin
MAIRKIVEIDRDLCDGCGLCTTACGEGALALDGEGKAFLLRELYCDGMGVCLNVCPTGALTIVERDSEIYDYDAARKHVVNTRGVEAAARVHHGPRPASSAGDSTSAPSELDQWPIQLSLHADLLRGRRLVIACPKLDDTGPYIEKLAELFRARRPKSLTVAMMTVPCCGGLQRIVESAVERSGTGLTVHTAMIGLDGEIVLET